MEEKHGKLRILQKELDSARKLALDIADSTPTMTWIFDADGCCLWADRQWLEFTGRPLEQETGDGWRQHVHPNDLPALVVLLEQALRNRESCSTECRMLRHDGQYRWLLCAHSPYYDADGAFQGFICSRMDITDQKNTERRLRSVNHSLKEAQRIARIGSWDWDIVADKLYWSDESFRLLGLEPSSEPVPLGAHMDRMSPADRERVTSARERALRTHTTFDVEYAVTAADGSRRYIHTLGQARYDEAGRPVYMAGTMQDITERKRAEQEVRKRSGFQQIVAQLSRSFINMPLEKLEDAINAALGQVGEYCGVDRVSVWKYDWERGSALRQYGWECFPDSTPGGLLRTMALAGTGTMVDCHRSGRHYCLFSCDPNLGAALRERCTESLYTFPMIVEGELFGFLAFSTVATGKVFSDSEIATIGIFAEMVLNMLLRKEQEEALYEANERNRLILDSINDGVAMFRPDGTILNTNREFDLRFGTAGREGDGLEERLPRAGYGDLSKLHFRKLRSVYESGKPEVFEDCRDGRWYSNRYYPVYKDGDISAITFFSTDITARRMADEEARKRLETETRLTVMTEFFTNVSHELKTPLALILMQLDMMRMHLADERRMQSLMGDATLNAYRLTRLVANLLDITKMDAGFLRLNLRNRDIVTVLRNICDSVREYAQARAIALEFDTGVAFKSMDMDIDKIERTILNLLSNAIKHTPEGGRIIVALRESDGGVVISVSDTGVGIPRGKLKSVFDRFVQVNNQMSRQTEGCGIGLALVKSMVELHGGSVWAESEPGQGCTFVIELPVRNEETDRRQAVIEGFELNKKVKMELSDLYIKVDA